MIRRLHRCRGAAAIPLAAATVGVWGCAGGTEAARFETLTTLPDAPRQPPGVAVDPATELPATSDQAHSGRGIAVLGEPRDPAAALEVVRSFFDATLSESESELGGVLDANARVRTGSRGITAVALDFWKQRFARLDYGALAGQILYRESEVESYESDDLTRLRPVRRFPMGVGNDQVLVRVLLSAPRFGRTRLYGDEILFLLSPAGSGYKIREMSEEFQIP